MWRKEMGEENEAGGRKSSVHSGTWNKQNNCTCDIHASVMTEVKCDRHSSSVDAPGNRALNEHEFT